MQKTWIQQGGSELEKYVLYLAELPLEIKFSSSLSHCELEMSVELGSMCLGMYLER